MEKEIIELKLNKATLEKSSLEKVIAAENARHNFIVSGYNTKKDTLDTQVTSLQAQKEVLLSK